MFPGEISVKKHVFERSELCFLGNKPLETLNPKRLMSFLFFTIEHDAFKPEILIIKLINNNKDVRP